MIKRFLTVYICFLVSLCIAMRGAEYIDSIQQLPTLEIVAKQRPFENVIPAQSLTGKKLQELNSHSVADALRYFSGIQLKDYGGVGGVKTIDMRSMGSNHMGVFYDGIQLGNAQNGQIDLGKFSLDNIEQVSLYNGQKSEILQSAKDYSSAGTIYLQTRYPKFYGANDNFRAIFRTGSFGLVNPSLLWEHKINESISTSANIEYTYATGKYKFRYKKMFSDGTLAWDTTATRKNGDLKALRAEAGIFGRLSEGLWNVKAYYYDSEKGIPGAIINNVWKNSQRQWDRNFFTQGSFRKRLSSFYELKASAKYARDYMRYLNPDTTLMYIDNEFWQQEVYASVANKFTILPSWNVNLAVDYQWNTLDCSMQNFECPTRNSVLTALASSYKLNRFSAQTSVLCSAISDKQINHDTNSKCYFTPSVFLSYQPFANIDFNVRTFYKRIFRIPTFNDLYYTDMGNIALNPEYATQYNLGFMYVINSSGLLNQVSLSVDGYYNEVTDKIIAVPKGTGQYRWMMMNIGKVKITGIDVSAKAKAILPHNINIDAIINYTYQSARDYTDKTDCGDGGTYKGMIPYIPQHSGSFTLHGDWRNFEINYSYIYVGKRYLSSANIKENLVQPWYTHDMSAGYNFSYKKTKYSLQLEINNLLNQQYEVIQNYPMPGRNFKVILKFDI